MFRIIFLIFCIALPRLFHAQQLTYSIINTNKGLPSSEVYAILEDHEGYMWFATDHGVSRYDGKEFKTYTTANGLPDNTVLRISEDRQGRIWLYTHSNELCYWQNDSIYQTPASAIVHKLFLTSEVVHIFYADSTGQLWFSSVNKGIIIKPEKNYSTYTEFGNVFDDSDLSTRVINVDNKKAIMTSHITFKIFQNFRKKKDFIFNFRYHKNLQPENLQTLVFDSKDVPYPFKKLVAGVSTKGVYYIAFDRLLFILEKGKAIQSKIMAYPVLSLNTDAHNGLWVGFRREGVAYYKNADLDLPPVTISEKCSVDDVCIDHEGGIWLATLEKGVLYIPSLSILAYSDIPQLNDHITFLGSLNNQIYVSTFNHFIGKEEHQTIVRDPFLEELTTKGIELLCLAKIRDTTYLSYNAQLFGMTNHLFTNKLNPHHSGLRMGKQIFELPDHSIWMSGLRGLSRLHIHLHYAKLYHSPFRTTCATPYFNDILVGSKKGVYLFKDHKYRHLGYLDPLLKDQIADMISDSSGTVWIATSGNGVLKFKDNKVTPFTEKDGLISNTCQTLCMDQYKHVWVGTNKGLSCIAHSSEQGKEIIIKNIDQRNGLNSNEITRLLASGNKLWVGTKLGLSTIDIPQVIQPIPAAPVYIGSISVNSHPLTTTITSFPYNQNNFKINLKGLTFKDNGDHLYRYRLIGQDSTWQEFKSDELLLNNLLPGNYTFQVQVANLDKIWSTVPAAYSFTINKPFWLTWWFIAIEVLVLIIIIYLIILWRTYIVKQKEAEKLRINKLLAEYQMKALTAQMNPHFIFNAINSIQNFIIQNHSALAYDYLIKFSKLIRLVLNNSNEKEISIQQELDTLAIYIELEQLRFKDSFQYTLIIDPQLELDSLMIPSLLLQPYIENAIWHGLMPLKTHRGMITLSIKAEKGVLKINITDNGVGRKASDQLKKKIKQNSHRSVGMELTGKRIELFGQENQFSIQLIDNYDESNNSTGTTVEIILPMIEIY